ncbi:MAG: hypothetical protein V3T28_01975, partial [Gemmatimonadales bacterium]
MPTGHWLETALSILVAVMLTGAAPVQAGAGALPDNDILMKAVVDELHRSMDKLALEDLPRPFFIQYQAQDRISFTMRAANGGLLRSDNDRTRYVASRVRVGSYKLDNTNVSRGLGGRAGLPLDDDYTAIRHALGLMTDTDSKRAVEVFTRKRAYLKQKNVADRPDDFSAAQPARVIEPSAEIAFDRARWEDNLRRLSGRFERYPAIQDSNVTFFAGAANQCIVNSEGTRIRTGDTGA